MARSKPVPVKSSKNQTKKEGSLLRKNPKSKRNLIQDRRSCQASSKLASEDFGTSCGFRSGGDRIKSNRGQAQETISSSLPPELCHAGLLASQDITKGKCFGPFKGIISDKKDTPLESYHFVCQLKNRLQEMFYFYVHADDKAKCSWLKLVKSCDSEEGHNIVAHTTRSDEVCYEAIRDISAGEELVALYDETYGKNYTEFVESSPCSEATAMDSSTPEALEEDLSVEGIEIVDVTGGNGDNYDGDEEDDDYEVEEDDDEYEVEEEEEEEDDDDDDYEVEEEEEDVINDENDSGSDPEFVPSNCSRVKPIQHCDERISKQIDIKVLDVVETISNEEDGEKEITKFRCSHCSLEFESRDTAEKHIESKECFKNLLCQSCDLVFETIELLECHNCSKKPRCRICNMVFDTKHEKRIHVRKCHAAPVECPVCHKTYNKSYMRDHLLSHNDGAFKCDICEKHFSSGSNLRKHKRKHEPGYVPPPDPRRVPKSDKGYWCYKCNIQFENRGQMSYHQRKEHPNQAASVECPICHKTYNSQYMRDHIKSHSGDPFKCDICEKLFSSRSNLFKHRRKHNADYVPKPSKKRKPSGVKRYECQECQKKFDTPNALEVHQRSHTGERPFACEKCEWKFSQKTHLTRHMKTVHDPDGPSNKKKGRPPSGHAGQRNVPCEQCGKIYASFRVLQIHMHTIHLGERPHKCDHCDATFTQRGHLWRHKHAVHPDAQEVKRKVESGKFACHFEGCEQAFACHSELVEHAVCHTGEKPFVCDQCGTTVASKGNLNRHKRRRHKAGDDGSTTSAEAFPCSLCGKVFTTSLQLQIHNRSHTGEKPYKCELCNKSFVQKSGLNKHIRCKRCPMIEGPPENPYSKKVKKSECKICQRMFPGPSELKAHERTHTGEKPFQCTICSKSFSQPGNLSKHVRYIHRKEKRPKEKPRERKFFCSLCGKAFMCASSLTMHCRTHTGSKPFACSKCDQSFAQAGNLKKHFTRCHSENEKDRPQKRKAAKAANSVEKNRKKDDETDEFSGSERDNSSSESENDRENENGEERENEPGVPASQVTHRTPECFSPASSLPSDNSFLMSTFTRTPLNTAAPGFSPLNSLLTSSTSFGFPVDKSHIDAAREPQDDRLATQRLLSEGPGLATRERCLNSNSGSVLMNQSRINGNSITSDGNERSAHGSSGNSLSEQRQHPPISPQQSFMTSVEGLLAETSGGILTHGAENISRARAVNLPHMHMMLNSRAVPGHETHGASSDMNVFPFSPSLFHQ